MHLILALLWLALGGALLAWHTAHPEDRSWHILGSNVSLGWLALLFACYNGLRWWSRRWAAAAQPAARRWRPRPAPGLEPTPDSHFDFSDPPSNLNEDPGDPSRQ